MKIAFLTPEYPHEKTGNAGGIGTSIKNLGRALVQSGHKVHILIYGQKQDQVFKTDSIMIHQIRNLKLKGLSWYLTRKKIESYINDLYSKQKIDIVEAPDWTGITSFIRPKDCPVVIRLNGSDTYFCKLENRTLKKKNYWHERKALKNADGHISVSQYTADKTNEFFDLSIKFQIIPNGIDTAYFKPDKKATTTPKQILYLGTLIRKKGLLDLAHIFNHVIKTEPEAQLVLVGSDASDITTGETSTWEIMKAIFSEQAFKNVKYLGKVPYEKVQQIIQDADICVFPSYAEALPVSWLEAMAMEKAVVASSIGWGKEVIIHGESGLLAHPSDHQQFAKHILYLFYYPKYKRQLEKKARERAVNIFSNHVIAQQSLSFYKRIINR